MTQPNTHHEQAGYPIVGPKEALRLYGEGVRRLRKPEPHLIGPGRDANSYDFRGVGAAMNVVSNFPHQTDAEGNRLPADPEAIKTHMEQGLAEITRAGRGQRPLADDFVAGYTRMSEAFSRPPEEPTATIEQVPTAK